MPSRKPPQLFGIHELYRPANSVPEVDIIAVHGLNGDRLRTWTTQSGPSQVCWLSHPDFLPRYLPGARVLTWGYNANVTSFGSGIASSERLLPHAQTLVAQLCADRDASADQIAGLDDASERPIIFVCHSLGGIVVKKALAYSASRTSSQITHLQSIYTCTFALLFLGTPHHGSSKARLLNTMTKLASVALPDRAISLSTNLLRALESESEALQEVTAAFVPIMPRFRIFFFWEQHKTDLKYTRDYIVEESSAAPSVDNTERCGIAADHCGMCRFAQSDDQGFRIVAATLKRYAHEALDVVVGRCRRAREVLEDERNWQAEQLRRRPASSEHAAGPSKEKEIEISQRPKSLVIKPAWQGE